MTFGGTIVAKNDERVLVLRFVGSAEFVSRFRRAAVVLFLSDEIGAVGPVIVFCCELRTHTTWNTAFLLLILLVTDAVHSLWPQCKSMAAVHCHWSWNFTRSYLAAWRICALQIHSGSKMGISERHMRHCARVWPCRKQFLREGGSGSSITGFWHVRQPRTAKWKHWWQVILSVINWASVIFWMSWRGFTTVYLTLTLVALEVCSVTSDFQKEFWMTGMFSVDKTLKLVGRDRFNFLRHDLSKSVKVLSQRH